MRKCESLDVKFKTSMSKASNCICNACHAEGTVMKLTFPVTKFHDSKNLRAKYYQFWLCEKCRAKLSFALEWPDDRPGMGEDKHEAGRRREDLEAVRKDRLV